ncbi:MAG: uroporphyrinogen-III synthase [Planctomycetes bacterium]|nr:uroporphyrinogen-III synthase [Planctomycetota bacterium]
MADQPLKGVRIALTRERTQTANMRQALEERGATVVITPLIKLAPTANWTETDRCLGQVGQYLWIVFSSAQAVDALMQRAAALKIGPDAFSRCKVACVGPGTARAAKAAGLNVDLQPSTQNGQGMSMELRMAGLKPGARVLAPRGNLGLGGLAESLTQAGIVVDAPMVYNNQPDTDGAAELGRALAANGVDAIAFASPSAVENALAALDDAGKSALSKVRLYSIGPSTSEAIAKAGLKVTQEARPHDMKGMIAAIERGEAARG